jgi:hypothetical protein
MSAEPDALSATGAAQFLGLNLKMRRRQAHKGVIPAKQAGRGFQLGRIGEMAEALRPIGEPGRGRIFLGPGKSYIILINHQTYG